jgi:excisionase family DNA binding protein
MSKVILISPEAVPQLGDDDMLVTLRVGDLRAILRQELVAVLKDGLNGHGSASHKDWLKADEAAQLYGLPKTWFEERGRTGDIARTKPGRYVLFKRRDVEEYLEKNKSTTGC